jgi:hypothetical protein
MKISISTIVSQIYIIPYIKITYDRFLNGDLELCVGWINKEVVIGI